MNDNKNNFEKGSWIKHVDQALVFVNLSITYKMAIK